VRAGFDIYRNYVAMRRFWGICEVSSSVILAEPSGPGPMTAGGRAPAVGGAGCGLPVALRRGRGRAADPADEVDDPGDQGRRDEDLEQHADQEAECGGDQSAEDDDHDD